jgi:cellulose synthase operon protein C
MMSTTSYEAAAAMKPQLAGDLAASVYWPYLATAAVLTTFAPEKLRPLNGKADIGEIAAMVSQFAEPIRFGPTRGQWRLADDVRQQVLRVLGRDSIQEALKINFERPSDPAQRALEELALGSDMPALKGRSLEDLLGLERAVDWLDGALDVPLPNRNDILARIEWQKLLEPMQRLAGSDFVGRETELAVLRRYVDQLPSMSFKERVLRASDRLYYVFSDRPPLMVYGPGGVGKSTLIARFILQHAGADNERPMPFVYLDFDRWSIYFAQNSSGGITGDLKTDALLGEALRQIRVQFPEVAADAAGLESVAAERADSEDTDDFAVSGHFEQSTDLRVRLAGLLNILGDRQNSNILLVVDTFEIVQRRGASAVYNLLVMVAFLMQEVRRLRVIIAGRANLRGADFSFSSVTPKWEELPLAGFDEKSGQAYLRQRLTKLGVKKAPESEVQRVVQLTGGNPLSLRLAAPVFARADIDALQSALGRKQFDTELANEQIQGFLHGRIVEHLEDDRLKRIANPGLIVRRINPRVIEYVLAGPCGLQLASAQEAVELCDKLRNEVSLVEPTENGELRHRPDVRLLMVPLIRRELGEKARSIDQAAVDYWRGEAGPIARAEEIYHRIWLGQLEQELDRCWDPTAGSFLQDALDELNDLKTDFKPRVWLADKLNRELSPELRAGAEQPVWERDTDRKARQLISDGYILEALNVVRERPDRLPASPIWILEADILRLLGRLDEALDVLQRALAAAAPSNLVVTLLLRRAAIEERQMRMEEALRTCEQALAVAERINTPASVFSALLICARLFRKINDTDRFQATVGRIGTMLDDPAVRQALTSQSALLRDAAAELGEYEPRLLLAALERFGLERRDIDEKTFPVLTGILKDAAPQLLQPAPNASSQVGRYGSEIAYLLRKLSPDNPKLWQELSAWYARSSDRLLNQTL